MHGQHQELKSPVSKGWMAFRCKGIERWCWSLYCALGLTGDLKGPFQVMVSHQAIMATPLCLWFSSEEKSMLPGPPEIFEAQGEHKVTSHHVVAYFVRGAADRWAPSVREMGWIQLNHSFIFPEHPAYCSGTHQLFSLLFLL